MRKIRTWAWGASSGLEKLSESFCPCANQGCIICLRWKRRLFHRSWHLKYTRCVMQLVHHHLWANLILGLPQAQCPQLSRYFSIVSSRLDTRIVRSYWPLKKTWQVSLMVSRSLLIQFGPTTLARISMSLAFYSAGKNCCLIVKSMYWPSRHALLRTLVVDPFFSVEYKQHLDGRCLSLRSL
jgi:hypothetical protein